MTILDIPHEDFGRLRLVDYLSQDDVVPLDDWEYLGRQWLGEAYGFTEWLRLRSEPEVLRSLALDLESLPASMIAIVSDLLRLPLRLGMTITELTSLLGRPGAQSNFVPDRTTYDFDTGAADTDTYAVGCTVHNERGLIYLTVHQTPLP